MSVPVFDVREVTFRYQRVMALDNLSLTILPGQRVALLGANGSGKSTLLRILDGLAFPEKGSIAFCGEPLTEEGLQNPDFAYPFRRRVGLVFQNPDVQLFSPTVFDEVAFGPLQLEWPREKVRAAVEEMLEVMKITHLRDRSPHHLSTGEKKRVTLACVLVLDPEVLLLDEPTAALDPKSASQMIDFLIGLRGGGKTVITSTHDLDIVEDIADQCLVFQAGRVMAAGTPAEILGQTSLLEQTNLVHVHRHVHEGGETHSHPHVHPHMHPHKH
jgi:cobalt/nickel transport system ATP-binding protein